MGLQKSDSEVIAAFVTQDCAMYRYFSSIRFLMLPVFVSLNVLFGVLFVKDPGMIPINRYPLFGLVPLAVVGAFLLMEAHLNEYINNIKRYLMAEYPRSFIGVLPKHKGIVTFSIRLIYFSFGLLWLVAWLSMSKDGGPA